MLSYIVEFLGTFLFLSVIIATGQPFLIALALLVVLLFAGKISGGYFNPAISLMFWAKGNLSSIDTVWYMIAQFLGGLSAFAIFKIFAH